jgi:hypothetical protein
MSNAIKGSTHEYVLGRDRDANKKTTYDSLKKIGDNISSIKNKLEDTKGKETLSLVERFTQVMQNK